MFGKLQRLSLDRPTNMKSGQDINRNQIRPLDNAVTGTFLLPSKIPDVLVALCWQTSTNPCVAEALRAGMYNAEHHSFHPFSFVPLTLLRLPWKCALLLLDENILLVAQNSEKKIRTSTKATVVGRAKIMSYKDKGPVKAPATLHGKSPHRFEAGVAEREIATAELSQYRTVLRFS
nr:hypothetical protein CFP56_73508 [Quercus suber]